MLALAEWSEPGPERDRLIVNIERAEHAGRSPLFIQSSHLAGFLRLVDEVTWRYEAVHSAIRLELDYQHRGTYPTPERFLQDAARIPKHIAYEQTGGGSGYRLKAITTQHPGIIVERRPRRDGAS
jgi:hypothetical protein